MNLVDIAALELSGGCFLATIKGRTSVPPIMCNLNRAAGLTWHTTESWRAENVTN